MSDVEDVEPTVEDTVKKSTRGFASHPHLINKGGRPKGSRNKSTLVKAQLQMDSDTEFAAELLGAIMRNDKEFLGIRDDVPIPVRITAAKEVLNKSIANEKDKEPVDQPNAKDEEEDLTPVFSPVPVAKNG